VLRVGDPLEHVIPAAIGGKLTTDRVCKECNNAASVIDQRFSQDWFVALERTKHELTDRKGDPPPHPKQKVKGKEDGRPYRINTMGGGFELEPVAQVQKDEAGNVNVSAASEEEAYRAAERILGDLEAQGFKVSEVKHEKLTPVEVEVSLKVDPTVYVREAAKMALGALSLVWPDQWLDSDGAKRLQRWVREDVPKDDEGETVWGLPGTNLDALSLVCQPPEHLVLLFPSGSKVTATFVLFGALVLPIHAETAGQAQPHRVWRMNPKQGSLEAMSLDELLTEAALRKQGKA
jgi:hypothetical protein